MVIKTRSQTRDNISHIGYKLVFVEPINKKNSDFNNFGIAELGIPEFGQNNENRIVVNAEYAKYRCDRAFVKKITSLDGKIEYCKAYSVFNRGGYYYTGHWIEADNYSKNLQDVCVGGIHYYLTKLAVINMFLAQFETINTFININFKNIHIYNPFEYNKIFVVDDDGKIINKVIYDSGFIKKIIYYDDIGYIKKCDKFNIEFNNYVINVYCNNKLIIKTSNIEIKDTYELNN